jgi:hypothetical protein
MSARRKLIRIATREGSHEWVKAEVFGFLAIHESLSDPGYVTITHIPTGSAVVAALPYLRARHVLVAIAGLDWNFIERKQGRKLKPFVMRAVERTQVVAA